MKDEKCVRCNGKLTEEKLEHKVAIPELILAVDLIHLQTGNTYLHNYNKFCAEKCYNLAILEDLINQYTFALMCPDEHFLTPNKDENIKKSKKILDELENFKIEYASR